MCVDVTKDLNAKHAKTEFDDQMNDNKEDVRENEMGDEYVDNGASNAIEYLTIEDETQETAMGNATNEQLNQSKKEEQIEDKSDIKKIKMVHDEKFELEKLINLTQGEINENGVCSGNGMSNISEYCVESWFDLVNI